MFKCQSCKKVTKPHESATLIVMETRAVTYPFRAKVNRHIRTIDDSRKVIWTDDKGGSGREIVREVMVCAVCRDIDKVLGP